MARWETRLLSILTPRRLYALPAARKYAVAVSIVVAATALRWALMPIFGTSAPYNIFFVALAVTTVLLGIGPGLAFAVLGAVAVEIFILRSLPTMFAGPALARLGVSLGSGVFVAWLLHAIREQKITHLASFPQMNPNPVTEINFSGMVTYANPATLGYLPDLVTQAPDHPYLAGWREAVSTLLDGGAPVSREVLAGGRWWWQLISYVPDTRTLRIYGHDVTERKKAEEALRQSRENLDRAQAVGQMGWWRLDTRKDVLTWSPENHRIFGVPEGTPMSYEFFLSAVHPDDRQYVDTQWAAGLRGDPYDIEHRILVDGKVKWVREKAYLEFDSEGKMLGGFGITQDITARREAEEALREREQQLRQARDLLEAVTTGTKVMIATVDREFRFTFFNREHHEELRRLTGKDTAIGLSLREALADMPEERDKALALWGRALNGETVVRTLKFGDPGRYRRWYSTHHTPIRNAAGEIVGAGEVTSDITELVQAQEALRESEERYRALFDSMTEGFALHEIITDEQGRPVDYLFLDVNPAFERLTGFKRADLLGKRVLEALPAVEAYWIETYGRVALTGEPVHFENFAAPLGRWYHAFAYRPAPRQFAVVFTDITERKRAEEALRQSERRFRQVAESLPQLVWTCAADGPCDYLSPQWVRYTGQSEADQLGYGWLEQLHPADRQRAIDQWLATAAKGENFEIEFRIRRHDGAYRWFHTLAVPLRDEAGRVVKWFGSNTDIDDIKRTEELRRALAEQEKLRLGAAVEQASDSIVMVDFDGTIRYVNAAFESINKIAREAATGTSYFDLLAGDPAAAAEIREAIASGRPWHGSLTRSVRDERPVELEVTISPAKDPSGAVIGRLITEKDVTRENALQKQVRQAQKMEALGTLAGGITHDFNNILGAIVINTELALLDLDPTNPARRPLPLVLQAASRGKELVKQIITFSRQRTWERKPLDVVPIVKEGLIFLRSTLPKEISIQETVDAQSGVVLADPSHIHQVLVNLCQNAALAMKDGGGRIKVQLAPVEADEAMAMRYPNLKPGPYARLTVSDTGCGMTKDVQERVFEPFFTTRGPGEGSGLGLAVVHGIVRTYDGEITVYSEPGKGSTFNVYFPRLEAERGEADAEDRIEPQRGEERILLVEDEAAQRESLERSLKHLGYRVTTRADGRSALTAFKKDPAAFDLIITDQVMPKMTGFELASAISALRPDVPIILCTGFSEKVNGDIVGRSGVRELIMKPYTIREITRLIRKVVS